MREFCELSVYGDNSMVTRVTWFFVFGFCLMIAGCGEPSGQNLEMVESQPPANLEAGKSANSMEEWAAANPNNGAPGSGESESK